MSLRGGDIMEDKQLVKECVVCNNEFHAKDNARGRKKQTCSTTCARKLGSMNSMVHHPCVICGDDGITTKSAVKQGLPVYCDEHKDKHYFHVCEICDKEFYSTKKSTRFCSQKCITEYNNSQTVMVECSHCGKEYEQSKYSLYEGKNNYCSTRCNNNAYSLRNPTRYGGTWTRVKKEILLRDNNKCLLCGSSEDLQQHHFIKMLNFDNPNDAHTDSNLGTFCRDCHLKIENESIDNLTDFYERYSPNFSES